MTWAGGVFSISFDAVADRDASIPITASRVQACLDDLEGGVNSTLNKDGSNTPSAAMAWGGFRLTGLGDATARTDAIAAKQVQDGGVVYAAVTGTDTYAATLAPAITAYVNGGVFIGKFANANTGAATLNLNAVGATAIRKHHDVALASGDIEANSIVVLVYNSTIPCFEIVGPDAGLNGAFQPLDADLTDLAGIARTRGDLIYGGATAWVDLAVGAANTLLQSDGTDPRWRTLTLAIDDAIGATQGQVLYRSGTAWTALAAGTSGQFLKTNGAAANPAWADVTAAGLTLIQAQNPSAVATLDFTTSIDSTYETYMLVGHLIPATDDVQLWLRTDSNGGASFDAGATDYSHGGLSRPGGTAGASGSVGDTQIQLTADPGAGFAIGNLATEGVSFTIYIKRAANAAVWTLVEANGTFVSAAGDAGYFTAGGARESAQADNAIRLLFESGNITSGHAVLFGVKKA